MLCTQVLNGLVTALTVMNFDAGREFDVVAVSFDPGKAPGWPSQKKAAYVERYGRPHTAGGWHFLTGERRRSSSSTDGGGLPLRVRRGDQAVRARRGIKVLTPKGHISRYFYGIEYSARDLRLGLIEASDERIGTRSTTSAVLLPLRPGDREVRRRRASPGPHRAASDRAGVSVVPVVSLRRERGGQTDAALDG